MTARAELTTVDAVHDEGSYLFTATDDFDLEREVIVVPCDDGESGANVADDGRAVTAWLNQCTHEPQALDTGDGVPMRDGQIICPRHGSLFDACSGECDNGHAAGSTLPAVDVAVEDGTVYLVDDSYTFVREGSADDGDDLGTSHVGF
jgi:nitrite reductase/ring-hydroxylating ferredoxin subunit